ncbi:MAG TPA: MXAN_5187 C-terminal domain-containing protein [Terriglobales bacterium]
MTIDEELTVLETQLRRLKIEYEMYFNNPTKKPPTDVEWKVLSLLRKFSDSSNMSFSQRYRYNEMAQRYAVYNDLWRKKARIREEGYRTPQDQILSVQGVRPEEKPQVRPVYGVSAAAAAVATVANQPTTVQFSDPNSQGERVEALYKALAEAKQKSGEAVSGNLKSFAAFVEKKTSQIRKQYGCETVEYSVEMQDGQVRLKAKAKV